MYQCQQLVIELFIKGDAQARHLAAELFAGTDGAKEFALQEERSVVTFRFVYLTAV